MELINSIVVLQPGMYILRHPKNGLPPLTVGRAPGLAGSSARFEVLGTKRTQGTILRDGSDCIVMHVIDGAVELLVTAYVERAGAMVPALKIDRIGLDGDSASVAAPVPVPPPAAPQPAVPQPAAPQPAAARPQPKAIEIGPRGLSLIGHIERTGDLVVAEGLDLGQPAADLRLEGFQIMWPDRPDGVELSYGIVIEGAGAMPSVSTGKFCGSRGEARRITEVTFALTGEQARRFALEGAAYFSGGFKVPVASGIALSGPSGLEHLVALNLRTVPVSVAQQAAPNPWDASPRTKIFKAPAAPRKAKAPGGAAEPKKTGKASKG